MSLAWSFADEDGAKQALEDVATTAAVDCFGKETAHGGPGGQVPGARRRSTSRPSATRPSRTAADLKLEGSSVVADYVFVRTGRVLTAAGFQSTGGAPRSRPPRRCWIAWSHASATPPERRARSADHLVERDRQREHQRLVLAAAATSTPYVSRTRNHSSRPSR